MRKRYKKKIGVFLMFLGVTLMLFSTPAFTGFVVGEVESPTSFPLIAIISFILGALIFANAKGLEAEVWEESNGEAFLEDPTLTASSNGKVSLEDFKKEADSNRFDPELYSIFKSAFLQPLIQTYNKNGEKKDLAFKFLKVIDYAPDIPREMPKEEAEEIDRAFNEFKGSRITKYQKRIFKKYGFIVEHGKTHPALVNKSQNTKYALPSTPGGDAKYVGKYIKDFVNRLYEKKYRESLQD